MGDVGPTGPALGTAYGYSRNDATVTAALLFIPNGSPLRFNHNSESNMNAVNGTDGTTTWNEGYEATIAGYYRLSAWARGDVNTGDLPPGTTEPIGLIFTKNGTVVDGPFYSNGPDTDELNQVLEVTAEIVVFLAVGDVARCQVNNLSTNNADLFFPDNPPNANVPNAPKNNATFMVELIALP